MLPLGKDLNFSGKQPASHRWLLLLLVCLWGRGYAGADDFQLLRANLVARNWPGAEAEIGRLEKEENIDRTELLFLSGMMALERNQLPRAIEIFRQILESRPDLIRVRLELGRALFLDGDYEAAQFHFERAMAANIPLAVADNIRHYLSQIRAKRRWSLDLSFGLLSDSNANGGSNRDHVDVGGLRFRIGEDAKGKSGNGWQVNAYGQGWMPLVDDHKRIKAWGSINRRDYSNDGFDETLVRVGAGPQWVFSESEFSLTPFAAYRDYGNDPYSRGRGLRGEYLVQLAPRWLGWASGEWQRLDNQVDGARSGHQMAADVRFVRTLDSTSSIAFCMDYLRELARSESQAKYRQRGASIIYHHDWSYGITYRLSYQYSQIHFNDEHPFFGEKRRDGRESFGVSLGLRNVRWLGFMPMLSLSRVINHSNIDFFSYERNVILLSGTKLF